MSAYSGLLALPLALAMGCAYGPTCPGALETLLVEPGQALRRVGLPDAAFTALSSEARVAVVGRWRPRSRTSEIGHVALSIDDLERGRGRARRRLPPGPMGERGIVLGDDADWLVRRSGDNTARIEAVESGALEAELPGHRRTLAGGEVHLVWSDVEGRMHLYVREGVREGVHETGTWRELASGPPIDMDARPVNADRDSFVLGDGELLVLQTPTTHVLVEREGTQLRALPERLDAQGLTRIDATHVAGVLEGRYCEWELGEHGLGAPSCPWLWRFDPTAQLSVGEAVWVWEGNWLEVVERSSGVELGTLSFSPCAVVSGVIVRGSRALVSFAATPLQRLH